MYFRNYPTFFSPSALGGAFRQKTVAVAYNLEKKINFNARLELALQKLSQTNVLLANWSGTQVEFFKEWVPCFL